MELPCRASGDQLLKPGELADIRKRLRNIARKHDLTSVVTCAFDHRTRMLPFVYADMRMAPAGVRAIGSAMVDAGFEKTRIVLQQWNKNFRPSMMRLDGRIPDIFMVSSMQLHSAQCQALIRNVCTIDPAHRPLVIAGGPKTIYEPWDVFSADPKDPWGADVAVTGEEYVLLNLLEVLLSLRADREPLRMTFIRARNSGILDEIPGLVYARTDLEGVAEELVDTGIQRLVGDLDELPNPVWGYQLLEPPSKNSGLSYQALPADKVRKYSRIGSLVMTFGCKFKCPYCPIPAYNQRQYRVKSGERIAEEMVRLYNEYGMRYYFGTDDNFFNDQERALEILEILASIKVGDLKLRKRIRWGTEVTVHDALKMKDYLALVNKAGVRALWLGVEDMTATLVKKGQSVDKTTEVFNRLRERAICPMPMMMHHDHQPLYTRNGPYGLLNQVKLLRKAGAIDMQVLMITPATGSKQYEESFTSGLSYESAAGKMVEQYMIDGNYVVASEHPQPWRKQFNIILAYLYFYNPLRFLIALVRPKSRLYLADAGMQIIGMWGLTKTIQRTLGWALRLMRGPIKRQNKAPMSHIPMRSVDGGPASHALPGTPMAKGIPTTADISVESATD
ncbi:MAG: radical SAM protein [Planctomycetota bacterium]|nr:MAG: radical SAM protein [Planctomycetota bacterium]